MDGFELNKVAGAILLAGVIAMTAGVLSRFLIPEPHMEESLIVATGAESGEGSGAKAEAGLEPIAPLLASASVDDGMKVARKCAACHTFEKDGANKVGPNLWNIVGGPKAHRDDFSYSSALAGMEGEWTYANLNAFLHKPRDYMPGTKMSFAGLAKVEDRAAIVAYLRSLSDNPQPLPEPAAEAPAPEQQQGGTAAPADEKAGSDAAAATPEQGGTAAPADGKADTDAAATPAIPEQATTPQGDNTPMETGTGEQPAQTGSGEAAQPADASADGKSGNAAPEKDAKETPEPEKSSEATAEPAQEQTAEAAATPLALIKTASVEDGAKVARKCVACHSFEKDAGNKVGPNLWGVVGGSVAHREDYKYSKAMAEKGGEWTYETLFAYLESPRTVVPGTKMTFAGLKKPEEVADVVAYMRTKSDEPAPLQ